MAEIVLGLGVAHSTQLNMPVEFWEQMGQNDQQSPRLLGTDGKMHTYQELLQTVGPEVAQGFTPAEQVARHARCQEAIAQIAALVRSEPLDAIITITDDERWLFTDGMMPAAYLYWGDLVHYAPRIPDNPTPMSASSLWAYSMEAVNFPGAAALGEHVVTEMADRGFDVAQGKGTPPGDSIGRPFGFIHARVFDGKPAPAPILPFIINASYLPNLLSTRRSVEMGEALAQSIRSWDSNARVGILAVGNFSHVVVDEVMDRRLQTAIEGKDLADLRALPRENFQGGNGQAKTWMIAAGAMQHLNAKFLDLVFCYRSPGGTGCAMPFAHWS